MALHQDGPVLTYGEGLHRAQAAMIMLHGRGATAEDILALAELFETASVAYLAPQAAGNSWYPYSFTAPLERNEPWLTSALARVHEIVQSVANAGIEAGRTYLLGFSQGACLTLEYAARHARRFGGVFGLSGGLIGPDATPRDYPGSMAGTPVFLGCSDVDPHIGRERVSETAGVFQKLGGDVIMRLYPNTGHTVNEDEVEFVRKTLKESLRAA